MVNNMKYLVTGVSGQLGYDVVKELQKRGHEALGTTHSTMDISNLSNVLQVVNNYKPDVIINCAAYTKVDNAEQDEDNCFKSNSIAALNMVIAASNVDAKLFYISSDYVFDGSKPLDIMYTTEDQVNPLNVYGKSKEYGEKYTSEYPKHFIVRTSWVFGINGNNFVKTMLKLGEKYDKITVVNDQVGSPTYTPDLAKLLVDMSETDRYGTYHGTNTGFVSWADFAKDIFEVNGKNVEVIPVTTEEFYNGKPHAERPMNSKLSKMKLTLNGFEELPSYRDALVRYKTELSKAKVLELKKDQQ